MIEQILEKMKTRRVRSPVNAQLKKDMEEMISSNKLAPGMLIPSESLLMSHYKICRASVRKVLGELEMTGRIVRKPGKGSFVRDVSLDAPAAVNSLYNIGIDIELKRIEDSWYSHKLLNGIENACSSGHARIVFFGSRQLESARRGLIDGLLMVSAVERDYEYYERLGQLNVHPALINRITDLEHIAYFSVNYRLEARRATEMLLQRGHRRIGIVGSDIGIQTGNKSRYLGILDALDSDSNAATCECCVVKPMQNYEVYRKQIADFIKKNPDISAIFLLNGSFAEPLFATLPELPRRVQENFEIMCFDDIGHLYEKYHIPFFFIKMPLTEMGHDAAEYLLNKIKNGDKYAVEKKIYGAEIVAVGYPATDFITLA
jgi:DNA-binding LacI/PurR family transcriptional regulator